MEKIIMVESHDEYMNEKPATIIFVECLYDDMDIETAMAAAVTEFANTPEQRDYIDEDPDSFTWAGIAENPIPDFYCRKHGFTITRIVHPIEVMGSEDLINNQLLTKPNPYDDDDYDESLNDPCLMEIEYDMEEAM